MCSHLSEMHACEERSSFWSLRNTIFKLTTVPDHTGYPVIRVIVWLGAFPTPPTNTGDVTNILHRLATLNACVSSDIDKPEWWLLQFSLEHASPAVRRSCNSSVDWCVQVIIPFDMRAVQSEESQVRWIHTPVRDLSNVWTALPLRQDASNVAGGQHGEEN